MNEAKPVSTHLDMHFKLCKKQCASSCERTKKEMQRVPFLQPVGKTYFLPGNTDVRYGGDIDTRKNLTSGYVIPMQGQHREQFHGNQWGAKELGSCFKTGMCSDCDIRVQFILQRTLRFHYRSKHIDTRYHWIRVSGMQMLELEKIHTDDNGSDMMTKRAKREVWRNNIMLALSAVFRTKAATNWHAMKKRLVVTPEVPPAVYLLVLSSLSSTLIVLFMALHLKLLAN
nr:Retrovirus-related Pol polyprotein from transposon TNT 1-94 [Ipomoea batatas]